MFKIEFYNKKLDLEIESAELILYSSHVLESEKIALLIEIETKGMEVEMFDEEEQENYDHYFKPKIYTEWLEIKTDCIKNKDFRSLENIVIDFDRTVRETIHKGMIWNDESPGALYVDNHGLFEKCKIEFKYIDKGVFNIKLSGSADYDTPFKIETQIPLEIKLKAYDNRETKEDILTYFNSVFDKDDFNTEWKYRNEDIIFSAKSKE